jgi:DNA-binding CsgD family transcriptional regulator
MVIDTLSRREKEVALLLLQGKSNNEICTELRIVIQTVKFHISKIYKKAAVKNRSQFIVRVLPELSQVQDVSPVS